jgi:hypothetical protein
MSNLELGSIAAYNVLPEEDLTMSKRPLGWFEKTSRFLRATFSITIQFGDTSNEAPLKKALNKATGEEIQQLRTDIDAAIEPHLKAMFAAVKDIFTKFMKDHP